MMMKHYERDSHGSVFGGSAFQMRSAVVKKNGKHSLIL
jgi:hypothetical protein